jgi:hypothetical protein
VANSRICSVDGCDKPAHGRGWCKAHYLRWRRRGDPSAGRTAVGEPERFYREVVRPYDGKECLPWPFAQTKGAAIVIIDGNRHYVARLICEHVHGPAPTPEHEAAHSCGNGHLRCVAKGHLSWKTKAANEADKLIHGTHNRGERHPLRKLTEDEVRQIRALKGNLLQREIAEKFGISREQVSGIHRRIDWAWLE